MNRLFPSRSGCRVAAPADSSFSPPLRRAQKSGAIRRQGVSDSAVVPSAIRPSPSARAFTLTELLVVISIMGILAALSVPALKNLGKSNLQVSATRQLVDDITRARQLAISQHTTVYMVFVPQEGRWWNAVPNYQWAAATNLLDKQCSGYTFVTLRSVGDQPGGGKARYVGEWRSLPDGAFIATNKFNTGYLPNNYYPIINYSETPVAVYPIHCFNFLNNIPFPTETNYINTAANPNFGLPFIAFNYLGQLTVDGVSLAPRDEYIPLAQGTVGYAADAQKALIPAAADFTETPPGNSTNSMFNVVRIDRLTGRTTLLQQKIP